MTLKCKLLRKTNKIFFTIYDLLIRYANAVERDFMEMNRMTMYKHKIILRVLLLMSTLHRNILERQLPDDERVTLYE